MKKNLELLCGLMIEAANSDGHIETEEVDKISSLLINVFKENADDVKIKLQQAINNRNNSKSLFYYTSNIIINANMNKSRVQPNIDYYPALNWL